MTVHFVDDRGPWMLTLSGKRLSVLAPDPSDIDVEDIAHGLATENRFGGQLPRPYSVAQHSLLVVSIVEQLEPACGPVRLLQALFHDASEGIGLKDLPTPVKQLLPEYRALEARLMAAVFRRLELPPELPAVIKEADAIALATERRDLFRPGERRLRPAARPLEGRIRPWGWRLAERQFLAVWRVLDQARRGVVVGDAAAVG